MLNKSKLNKACQIISNMGWKYVLFRLAYEIKRKTGILKWKYPVNPVVKEYISFFSWKENTPVFFFNSREEISFDKKKSINLHDEVISILSGKLTYFNSKQLLLDGFDWYLNPQSGYRYSENQHWTKVNDYDKKNGDIKYVWEASRFTFLYTIIRNDYHNAEDHSEWVLEKIIDWINKNPLNMGPNYKCSQEISLRLLNWIFALYFYKTSPFFNEERFKVIMHSIYWQIRHVYSNIKFSRISVRNNHAITETLLLYLSGLFFPFFPEAKKWKDKGKKWFEDEIEYQIYEDGTHLQFSTNYHRVVVQLLTWAIRLSELHGEQLRDVTYNRAYLSLNFLYQCQEDSNGFLPNYGSNDGALFFNLSDSTYRDYRPQLDALHWLLCSQKLYDSEYEDIFWYGFPVSSKSFSKIQKEYGIKKYSNGGIYLIREENTLTFICCKEHKDRPAHADNLHIDIWHNGENILLDGGTYQYNTNEKLLKYFMGTESHNTVMIDDYDQMYKGSRFIWYNWSQVINDSLIEQNDEYCFLGIVSCFSFLNKKIRHTRKIIKKKNEAKWIIEDIVENKPEGLSLRQIWHTNNSNIQISSENKYVLSKAKYSSYYDQMEEVDQIEIITKSDTVKSIITIK